MQWIDWLECISWRNDTWCTSWTWLRYLMRFILIGILGALHQIGWDTWCTSYWSVYLMQFILVRILDALHDIWLVYLMHFMNLVEMLDELYIGWYTRCNSINWLLYLIHFIRSVEILNALCELGWCTWFTTWYWLKYVVHFMCMTDWETCLMRLMYLGRVCI